MFTLISLGSDTILAPLLVCLERPTNRLSKQDLCNAVKLELSKYGETYGELFEEIYKENKLQFSFENEIFPLQRKLNWVSFAHVDNVNWDHVCMLYVIALQ